MRRVAKTAVEPVPRPTTMPGWMNETACSAAARLNGSVPWVMAGISPRRDRQHDVPCSRSCNRRARDVCSGTGRVNRHAAGPGLPPPTRSDRASRSETRRTEMTDYRRKFLVEPEDRLKLGKLDPGYK